ncbi:hypothetical protein HYX01_02410 [Candidatus Woesearchaeota archaeon]|nr:hypothetical protein [Candidatus Woesearchaeota archaeon]
MSFQKEKNEFLCKKDKSKKGSIDIKIKNLVDKINSFDDFFTTSSCSGRILLIAQHKSGRKDKAEWLFSSHNKINFKKIKSKKSLEKLPKKDVWFKMEPAIVHIACKNFENASKLLNLARNIGFRRSGIISIGKNRLILELISTEKLDAIIGKNGKLLVNESYFKILIRESNKKLEKTWEKINRLHKSL